MKPLAHARIAAHRYGGTWQDWLPFHDFFDSSKAAMPSMQHRMFLHSDYGVQLFIRIFGEALYIEGRSFPADQIAVDHQEEDLGEVVPLTRWLAALDHDGSRTRPPAHLRDVRSEPEAGLAARYGGEPRDYCEIVAFFDAPRKDFADGDRRADLVLHNAFGIFLAERLFGAAITIDGRLRAVRSIAEDLVVARMGHIPTAAGITTRLPLEAWMCGSNVPNALQQRHNALLDTLDTMQES